jgi:hypothetical protein
LRFNFTTLTGVEGFVKGFGKGLYLFSFSAKYYVIRGNATVVC